MTADELKAIMEAQQIAYDRTLETCLLCMSDEEKEKIPTIAFSEEDAKVINAFSLQVPTLKEDDTTILTIHSLGGAPFKLKTKTNE